MSIHAWEAQGFPDCADVWVAPPQGIGWREGAEYGVVMAEQARGILEPLPRARRRAWVGEQSSWDYGRGLRLAGIDYRTTPGGSLPDPLYRAHSSYARGLIDFADLAIAPYAFSWVWETSEKRPLTADAVNDELSSAMAFAKALRAHHPEISRVVWQISNGVDPWRGSPSGVDAELWWVKIVRAGAPATWYDVVAWWLAAASRSQGYPVEIQLEALRNNQAFTDCEALRAAQLAGASLSIFNHHSWLNTRAEWEACERP